VTSEQGNESAEELAVVSRRDFLKQAGAVAVSVVFVGVGISGVTKGPAFPAIAESGGVIMPNPSLCIGCLTCEVACSDVHREVGLSAVPRIRIYNLDSIQVSPEITRAFGQRGKFVQQVCLQCPDAPCLPVCPVEALRVDEETGARVIDRDTCIACGKCEKACLFPTLDEALATSNERLDQKSRITYDERLNVYAKCDLCYFREEGPACIERCPVNIRINQKLIQSDVLCLDLLQPVNARNFESMRKQQAVTADRKELAR
jgi:Fe-S-cluster-containing hydrogenase component 2